MVEKRFAYFPELITDFVSGTMYKFVIEKVEVMDSAEGIHSFEYLKV